MSGVKNKKGKGQKEIQLKLEKDEKIQDGDNDKNTVTQISEGKDTLTQVKECENCEKMKRNLDEAQKKLLYLRAEFDNYRKNMIKERSQLTKYGSKSLVTSLLDVVDTFEQALQVDLKPNRIENFKDGMKMVCSNLKKTLEDFGVKEISFQKGTEFDPALHEAFDREDSLEVQPGCILKVYRKAYKLHDVVIRPAQVSVASQSKNLKPEEKAKE